MREWRSFGGGDGLVCLCSSQEVLPQRGHGLRPYPAAAGLGSNSAMMVPSSGPQKWQLCRGKAAGSGGPRPLGAVMDSTASSSPSRTRRASLVAVVILGVGTRIVHEGEDRAAPRPLRDQAHGGGAGGRASQARTELVRSELNRRGFATPSARPPAAARRSSRSFSGSELATVAASASPTSLRPRG